MTSGKYCRVVVDWIGHDNGSTSFEVRTPQGYYDEFGHPWDVIERDWERLK